MLNNFIGRGKLLLHQAGMFKKLLKIIIVTSTIIGGLLICNVYNTNNKLDIDGAITYWKAKVVLSLDSSLSSFSIRKKTHVNLDTYSQGQLWEKKMLASSIISSYKFSSAWNNIVKECQLLVVNSFSLGFFISVIIFIIWSNFSKSLKQAKKKEGNKVLTALQVKRKLNWMGKASAFKIGHMSLVKNNETKHFLITGSTGSGKTNLLHNLLPQIELKKQPTIIIDQTGEMIARYYNTARGDIIFNPFDGRGKAWDLWQDCASIEEQEKFSKTLFNFNRKRSKTYLDPLWEQSAKYVFNECVKYLIANNAATIKKLKKLVIDPNLEELQQKLKGTKAEKYLIGNNKDITNYILSILTTTAKPISYLSDNALMGHFSIKKYLQNMRQGSKSWLFLATKPSHKELTLPLISYLTELALTQLINMDFNKNHKVWFIFDKLANLGNLPTLSTLMVEGRKYGSCIVATLQNLNQLYDNYGSNVGSKILNQFGTSFFFKNTEPKIDELFSNMCTKQQKNTSFSHNEFSSSSGHNEYKHKKALINELISLNIGECYTLLPERKVGLSKIKVPKSQDRDKNEGFIQK